MQISNTRSKGTFNYNTPEVTHYEHQEFPRAVYRGEKHQAVETQEELDEAIDNGWFLKKSEALDALEAPASKGKGKGRASQEIPEIPDDEEDDLEDDVKHSRLPVGETRNDEAATPAIDRKPAKKKAAAGKKKQK